MSLCSSSGPACIQAGMTDSHGHLGLANSRLTSADDRTHVHTCVFVGVINIGEAYVYDIPRGHLNRLFLRLSSIKKKNKLVSALIAVLYTYTVLYSEAIICVM